MSRRVILAAVLWTVIAMPAMADDRKDLTIVPESPDPGVAATDPAPVASATDAAGSAAPTGLAIKAHHDKASGEAAVGEAIKVSFEAATDANVYVIGVGTSGQSDLIFPNKKESSSRVVGGVERTVPGPDARYRVTVSGPPGVETVIVLACTKEIDVYKHLSLIAPRKQASALTLTAPPMTLANKDLNLVEDPAGPNGTVRLDEFFAALEREEHVTRPRDLACTVFTLTVKGP